jgi:hypothetical protein
MSVRDSCQIYQSSTNVYWKTLLGDIIAALKNENHPDQEIFSSVACMLMMRDKPGYWHWLNLAIRKLIDDPTSRLDQPPDLPDYDEMSDKDLVEKYEINNEIYPRSDILTELKYRHPELILTDEVNLKDVLSIE